MAQLGTSRGPFFGSRSRDPLRGPCLRHLGVALAVLGYAAACSSSPNAAKVDCSNASCALSFCDQECTAPCGCCSCLPGSSTQRNGKLLTCVGGCFADVAPDASTNVDAPDAGKSNIDAATAPDSGTELDCSAVGCGPPPLCGQPCGSPCGCCACASGTTFQIDGVIYECKGTCYGPVAPTCPAAPPSAASTCDGDVTCTYLDCAGSGVVSASCGAGQWDVTATPCAPMPCGAGDPCDPGMVCIQHLSGFSFAECASNPCGTGPITCECAGSLCGAGVCSTSGTTIVCNNCPSGPCP